jgi:hypothetical protein
VGLKFFSVGDTGALLDGDVVVVVVVVVVVLDGAGLPPVPQPAVNAPTAMTITATAGAITRRTMHCAFIAQVPSEFRWGALYLAHACRWASSRRSHTSLMVGKQGTACQSRVMGTRAATAMVAECNISATPAPTNVTPSR